MTLSQAEKPPPTITALQSAKILKQVTITVL